MSIHPQTPLAAALLLAGVINLLPLVGVLGVERLQALYGMAFDDPSLRILMRHRAVLFGLLGGAMLAAAFIPPWRMPMAAAGLISMLAFIVLAMLEGGGNTAIRRVINADAIAIVLLVAALLCSWRS